ncbi:DICT sensory domain-containing protein [Halarchaeum grantii]|uniref:DICT sensory domain-containing protein n=1 Tax=Halarchaeum grantii TaxID=1193105 RepID=UPI0016649BDD|nr:DICT sensory domain-containing protein [Halarchaeum grantii]
MGLRDVLETVRSHEKTLTVYAQRDAIVSELRDYFASQNVAVRYSRCPPDAAEHAVLAHDGVFEAAVGLAALRTLVDPDAPPKRVGEPAPYQPVLEALDGATFASYDHRQTLHATREVEDRAWRAGSGTLHAGFQRLSTVREQRETYARLATRDLDVHVYGAPDADVRIDGVTVHADDSPDVTETWFVVYDGGPDPQQKSALVAEERTPGAFYGVWTYDGALVDRLLAALGDDRLTTN